MSRIRSFPPLESPAARILILGSMPGRASLAAGQYYAHPQNAFWSIMGSLVGADPALPYPARVAVLKASGIALWDVLASCERKGSLDADIRPNSMVANDFAAFFASHPQISAVLFNGSMAEASFRRHAATDMGHILLRYMRLPSTSPAHAALTRIQKLEAWRGALQECGIETNPALCARKQNPMPKLAPQPRA